MSYPSDSVIVLASNGEHWHGIIRDLRKRDQEACILDLPHPLRSKADLFLAGLRDDAVVLYIR
jgi:hypothetical protein